MGKLIFFAKFTFVFFSFIFTSSLLAQSITNTLGTSGVFKIKDGAADYLTLTQSTGQVNILRSLKLENTLNSTTGVIYKGGNRFIHSFAFNNMFFGLNSGNFTLTGSNNSAFGVNTLVSLTTGIYNSAYGEESLYLNTTGGYNSAYGNFTLRNNSTGFFNSAFGIQSLNLNTTGSGNSAFGTYALFDNTTASNNSAFGHGSLENNTTGVENSAFGYRSLHLNTTTGGNSAFGHSALYNNTAYYNSAFGFQSLYNNTTGFNNSAFGTSSLYNNTTGAANTTLGNNAGVNITTGGNNTCIGFLSQPSSGSADNQVTLGNGNINSLRCNVQTITSLSDARDKTNIQDLSLGIDFIMKLKPRQFNWDRREWYDDNVSDGSKMQEAPTAGFIAQELDEIQTKEKADWLNLVLKDNPQKFEATYGNLLPIMVKGIQELKTENDELKTENDELKERLLKLEQMQSMLAAEFEKMKQGNPEVKEIKLGEK